MVGCLGDGSQESPGEVPSQVLTGDAVGLPDCSGGERDPLHSKVTLRGTSLAVRGLRLYTPDAGGLGSSPSQGTRSCMWRLRAHMSQLQKSPHASTKTRHHQINSYEKNQSDFLRPVRCTGHTASCLPHGAPSPHWSHHRGPHPCQVTPPGHLGAPVQTLWTGSTMGWTVSLPT